MCCGGLIHYRHINIAVLLGVAVAASVLTGALTVGDSVRFSLRNLTLDRLGAIDYALIPDRMIDGSLLNRIETKAADASQTMGIGGTIFLSGSAVNSGSRASKVQISGITSSFVRFFGEDGSQLEGEIHAALKKPPGQVFPSAVINQALARELSAQVGSEVLLSFENPTEIHRDSVYGDKDAASVLKSQRVVIAKVLADQGMG